MQSIVFDVSQNLESIQATRDCVRSTAIALVKVESSVPARNDDRSDALGCVCDDQR